MTSQEQMNKTYLDIKSGNRKQYAHKDTRNEIEYFKKGFKKGYSKGYEACLKNNKIGC